MNAEELVKKVGETVRLEDNKKRDTALRLLSEGFREKRVTFIPQQVEELKSHAFHLLHMPHPDFVIRILEMILHGSDIEVKTKMKGSEYIDRPENFDERRSRMFDLLYDIMQEQGIVDPDETALYLDIVFVRFVNSNSLRNGYLILTNKRAILFGRYVALDIGRTTTYRLYYDDWKERPYLTSFDFLEYDRIGSISFEWKFRKKQIDFKYRTKYISQKQQVFGGPLFFQFDFGKSMALIDGSMDIVILADPMNPEEKVRLTETAKKLEEMCNL
ncbi:MAG: hypothetical protein P1Q69_12840 [Candidatus Thorarchaeota archaeon]|nr:hypothetical protein [Candidatus Thorarchaeota archaeon]